ncbi:hypothetical protein AB1K32_14410 [Metabacillus dongyingensis]|uniref:UPF0738 family protein n=1 Tax=Metabacillus dongyingensis TaxID=2874282 RepID=UPI003B8C132A
MKRRIEVNEAVLDQERMILKAMPFGENDLNGLTAKGQMLVDSDQLAFIYIMDNNEDFIYTNLPAEVWPQLKTALDSGIPVDLNVNGLTIELTDIHDELSYLLENIKDNANYGEEMEKKVVEAFGLND